MSAALKLDAPSPPLELVRPVKHEEAMTCAMREAIRVALDRNFELLDRLELDYLNVLVRLGEFGARYQDGTPHEWFNREAWEGVQAARAPFVVDILRGAGPSGRQALAWQLRTKCRRCAGLLRHLDCRVCEGKWYVDDFEDCEEPLITDLEGVLLPEGE